MPTATILPIRAWAQSLGTVATVLGLFAIGWLGHATHWTFQPQALAGHHERERTPQPIAAATDQSADHHRLNLAEDGSFVIEFPSADAVNLAGIATAAVEERPLSHEVAATGMVSYDDRLVAQLSPRVAGTVWRVEKHLGELVQEGEILAFVESEAVGRMKAEFLNALVTMDVKTELVKNLQAVQDAVMGRQVRDAQSALREARIRLLNAEQALVNLGFRVDTADFTPLSDEQRSHRIRTQDLPDAIVNSAAAQRLTSNLVPLRAPFEGVLISRNVVAGEVVEPARPAFEIADTRRMWVTLDVSKEDVLRIQPGQAVRFRPDGAEAEIRSRISWISTELNEQTRTLKVRAEVDNPLQVGTNRLLRAHTFGTGHILLRENAAARVVPRNSVQWDGQNYVVFVQRSPTVFEGRTVSTGLNDAQFAELLDAFPVGTVVAAKGSHALKSQWLLSRMETAAQ